MSTIQTLMARIQAKLDAVPGIRSAPLYPPEQMLEGPFAVVYPGSGEAQFGTPGSKKELVTMVVEVMVVRKDLPRDIQKVTGFHDLVLNALMGDTTFGGLVDTYGRIDWTFGPLQWGDTDTVGYKFQIREIKVRSVIG